MTQNSTYLSVSIALLVALSAAVGAVAIAGPVIAQAAGGIVTDESFYAPSAEDPLNVRFRDCCSHTVHSVDEGVLNLNIVYGMATNDELYDVEITASGLNESQIEAITFDSAEYDTEDLSRVDIVGMNFTGVPAGEYEFTVSVVGTNATATVPLSVTEGPSAMGNATEAGNATVGNATTGNTTEMDNATQMGNATEMGNETDLGARTPENATQMNNATAGNATITAAPSAANATANHTVTVTVGQEAAGNLTGIAINYTEGNVSTIGATLISVNVTRNGTTKTLYTGENVTSIGYGFSGEILNISFGGTHVKPVSAGDAVTIVYSGVENAPQPGNYNVTVDINPTQEGGVSTAQLSMTTGGANATTTTTTPATTTTTAPEMGAATTPTAGTTMATGTSVGTAAPQTITAGGGAGTSDGAGANGSGEGQQGTEVGGPGFTAIAAVVALLAAALLAVRRR